MRRKRVLILKEGSALSDLDMWPGDIVIRHGDLSYLGTVNKEGQFVAYMEYLN